MAKNIQTFECIKSVIDSASFRIEIFIFLKSPSSAALIGMKKKKSIELPQITKKLKILPSFLQTFEQKVIALWTKGVETEFIDIKDKRLDKNYA